MVHKVVKNNKDAVVFGDKFIVNVTKGNEFLEVKDATGKVTEKLGFTVTLDEFEKANGGRFTDVQYGYMTKKARDRRFNWLVSNMAKDRRI